MNKILTLLQPYRDKFNAWWQGVSPREQNYLRLMFIFVGIAVVYFGIYQPTNNAIAALQQAVNYQNAIVQNIQPKIAKITSLQRSTTQANSVTASNLLTVVDNNLKQQQLSRYATEVSQTSSSGVQIKFSNIGFDQMTQWLISIWQQYKIQVSQIDVRPTKTLGNVDVLLTLQST